MTAVETKTGLGPLLSPTLGVSLRQKQFRRSQFAVVLVLAPINGTFEKKSLIVPFAPDVMKLGRQTNAKTVSSPDNGYFDSRVLSRQHAEIWADKDTGKVWLKDCKSSNGTYINKQRLSGENTESEPFELKRNDLIELGIDIACDDNSAIVYKKISARVDRVTMIPLHVKPSSSKSTLPIASPTITMPPKLQRSGSVSTLKGDDKEDTDSYATAIFGAPTASLESMALTHSRNTVGGLTVKADIIQNVEFELASKRLVAEIRAMKADLAKVASIKSMLEDMRRYQQQAQPTPIVTLCTENERMRSELSSLTQQIAELKAQIARPVATGSRITTEKIFKPSDINNLVLLVSSSVLMVITGVCIMLLFNPPTWQD